MTGRAIRHRNGEEALSADDLSFLDGLAFWLARRRLATAAVLFLESVKPLNFVGSQAMFFFEPVVKAFLGGEGYTRFARLMERRETVEVFLQRIEAADEAERTREKEAKAARKKEKTGRKGNG